VSRFREPFPIVYAEDVRASVDFYTANFGFDVTYRWPPEGELEFAFLKLEPVGIGIVRRTPEQRGSWELCIYTDDTDEVARELRLNGVEEVVPPTDKPWGERLAYFRDPDGNLIHLTATVPQPPPAP
jgi:lactoylglutathione lyase